MPKNYPKLPTNLHTINADAVEDANRDIVNISETKTLNIPSDSKSPMQ